MPGEVTLAQAMKHLEQHGGEKVRLRYRREGAGDDVLGVLVADREAGGRAARAAHQPALVDELVGCALAHAPVAPALQAGWMDGNGELLRRAGWRILAGRIEHGSAKDHDVGATLTRIERELPRAPTGSRGMNDCLFRIGVHLPAHRAEVIAVGERHRPMGPEAGLERLHIELCAGVDAGLARALPGREDRGPQGDGRGTAPRRTRGGGKPATPKRRPLRLGRRARGVSDRPERIRADDIAGTRAGPATREAMAFRGPSAPGIGQPRWPEGPRRPTASSRRVRPARAGRRNGRPLGGSPRQMARR